MAIQSFKFLEEKANRQKLVMKLALALGLKSISQYLELCKILNYIVSKKIK